MKIAIKKAQKKDWLILAKLHQEFQHFHFKIIDKISRKFRIFEIPFTYFKFCRILRNKKKLYLVAKHANKIIGFGLAEINPKKYHGKKVLEGTINKLYVSKEFRGQGIATSLRTKIYKWFKAKKVDFVDICVYAENSKAIDIYKEWGYKPLIVVMEKEF